MLHILALPRLDAATAERIAAGDDVLLQRGTVWALLPGHQDQHHLATLVAKSCRLHVLGDWLAVNGLTEKTLFEQVQVIDYPEWIELTIRNQVIQTWR